MSIEIKVPPLPESVSDATLVAWHKRSGESVNRDENLVDLETGGLGIVIQDGMNSSQTTTLAKFNTLGILLSACIENPDACAKP